MAIVSRKVNGLLTLWSIMIGTPLYIFQGSPLLSHGFVSRPSARSLSRLTAKKRDELDEYYNDGYYYDNDLDGDEEEFTRDRARSERRRVGRSATRRSSNKFDTSREKSPNDDNSFQDNFGLPSPFGRKGGVRISESVSKALLAGVFVLGIGTGVTVDSAINTNPKDLASRDAVDRNAPNPTLCTSYGASAMAFDQRVFVSFDPFNVYVAQADVKPACVLRPANVVPVLQGRGLLNNKEVAACKANMNTWAFVGDLGDMPQLSCVYQSEDAQNEFLEDPKLGIGEDYLDDDRRQGSSKKFVKDGASKRPAISSEDSKVIQK